MAGIANTKSVRLFVFFYDITVSVIALVLALLLRHGTLVQMDARTLILGGLVPFGVATAASLLIMKTYRTSWRHASTADLTNIFYTVSLAVLFYLPISFTVTRLDLIPRTSIVMAWMVLFLLMAGSRIVYRLYRERGLFFSRRPMLPQQLPILIVGGGTDAEILLRILQDSTEYYPAGILADQGQGVLLRGVPILGRIADAETVIESFAEAGDRPRKLVVVDRLLPAPMLDRLVDIANRHGLTIARGPDPKNFRPGTHDAPELQPISVEDLLGRSQIVLDPAPVQALLAGKRVLVTGAGGSIGSEIVRQVCSIGPSAICLVDSSEFNLYTIDGEVAGRWPELSRHSRLIDVRHRASLDECFRVFRPEVVFHAAALKHVPLVEENPIEGIWTNVVGTRNVADLAIAHGCPVMVLISTDKAVNPSSVMGASKRCAEAYCQALALGHAGREGATRIVAVRFGNVLGSTGSVVPLFERQIRAGGPITVTHPEIERYFMTIREAVQLVLQASAFGASHADMAGRVFVLDMGKPVRIAELARQMVRLAGLQPERDIAIRFTGLRPGEKLYEELFHGEEQLDSTPVPRLNVGSPRAPALPTILEALTALEAACVQAKPREVMTILQSLVPDYVATTATVGLVAESTSSAR